MKKLSSALLAGIAGGAVLLAASPAMASTAKGARPSASASPGILTNLPPGYTIVTSLFAAPDGTQTHGSVTCPGNEVPSGGGAVISSSALEANLNSSNPSGQGWSVWVNNNGGLQTTVKVFAVCIKPSLTYTVVSQTFAQAPMSTTSALVYCPAHTVVIGGGVSSDSLSSGVNIDSTMPGGGMTNSNNWAAAMSNSTSTSPTFTVYSICRSKPSGYAMVGGPSVTVPPSGEVSATTNPCPGASVPIAGGGYTGASFQTSDTAVDMNSTAPNGKTWQVYENNLETTSTYVVAVAICAGT